MQWRHLAARLVNEMASLRGVVGGLVAGFARPLEPRLAPVRLDREDDETLDATARYEGGR